MAEPAARLWQGRGTSALSHRARDVFQLRRERVADVAEKSGTMVPKCTCGPGRSACHCWAWPGNPWGRSAWTAVLA